MIIFYFLGVLKQMVVISRVLGTLNRALTISITTRLFPPLITTHEPPSKGQSFRVWGRVRSKGSGRVAYKSSTASQQLSLGHLCAKHDLLDSAA